MNEQHIQDALGEISEELIAPVEKLRTGKRYSWFRWAALAACFCLIAGMALGWDGWRATSKMEDAMINGKPENAPAEMEDPLYSYGSIADGTSLPCFRAKVLEAHDTYMLVEPLEGEQERTSADKIEVSFAKLEQIPALKPGDTVEIFYDGMLEEVYPPRARNVVFIKVVE